MINEEEIETLEEHNEMLMVILKELAGINIRITKYIYSLNEYIVFSKIYKELMFVIKRV